MQASGTLHPLKQVDVGAQVNGQVMRLLVEEDDRVKQGDLLAEIDATVAKNTLRKMEAEQVKAKSMLRVKHTFASKQANPRASTADVQRRSDLSRC